MITLNEIKGDFSLNATIVRALGLILFKFIHPFPASILNEMIDLLDTPLSPKIKDKITKNNFKYQFPDKILDFILYGFWLMIPIIQKKWFSPLLITAMIFRSIGLYYFLTTKQESYFTKFPNFFIYWFFLLYGLEYFDINVSKNILIILLIISFILKILHEHLLRGKYNYLLKESTIIRKEILKKINLSYLNYYILIIILTFILFWKILPSKNLFNPFI